jgi:hypothetical protein
MTTAKKFYFILSVLSRKWKRFWHLGILGPIWLFFVPSAILADLGSIKLNHHLIQLHFFSYIVLTILQTHHQVLLWHWKTKYRNSYKINRLTLTIPEIIHVLKYIKPYYLHIRNTESHISTIRVRILLILKIIHLKIRLEEDMNYTMPADQWVEEALDLKDGEGGSEMDWEVQFH